MHQQCFALGQAAAVEHIAPDGEIGFRQASRLDLGQALGYGQALRGRRHDVFGVPAARHQCAHLVPHRETARGRIAGDDLARHFEARQIRGARRRGIRTHALQHIGPIDPRGGNLDQHLARPGLGHGPLARHQHLGTARLCNFHHFHIGSCIR